jgi:hypothetical protein
VSILSEFEDRLGGAIEGAFSNVFRSPVQPAELARAAGKEMGRSRKLGIDKVYVANVYSIFLSLKDTRALGGLTATLEGELETYLLAYAREHDFALATRPVVRFATDDQLRLGRFDVIGEQLTVEEIFEEIGEIPGVTDALVRDEPGAGGGGIDAGIEPGGGGLGLRDLGRGVESGGGGGNGGYEDYGNTGTSHPDNRAARYAQLNVPGFGLMTLEPTRTYTLGRRESQQGNTIVVEDANVSRQHARLQYDGRDWVIEDLGSTNGTFVNGRKISAPIPLRNGEVIRIGMSELPFSGGGSGR